MIRKLSRYLKNPNLAMRSVLPMKISGLIVSMNHGDLFRKLDSLAAFRVSLLQEHISRL